MNKEIKLIPKLRFPEFVNDGSWEAKTLAEVTERIEEKVNEKKLITASISAGTGFVSQAEKFSRDISGAQYKNYIVLNEGEFSYNKGNSKKFPQGCIYKLKGFKQVAVPNAFISFRFRKNFLGDFYQGYFDNNYHGFQLQQFITSGARMDGLLNIKANDFFSIVLPTPLKLEQQKIASCLSSLDDGIAANTQKLSALKDHKKGLMQNLFPKEGETVPKWRFKEFEREGEWVEKSIQKLIDEKEIVSHLDGNHGALYPKSEEFSSEGIPYITANDFTTGMVDFSRCKHLPLNKAMQFKKGVAMDGDILFAHNATVGPVAKLETTFPFVILSTTATYYRCDNKQLINDFLKFSLLGPFFVKQYTRVMSQSTRNQVPITTQREFFIQFTSPKEQQKIASCLTSLDALITAQVEKIEQLKLHKKGLMQGLFPKINE